MKPTLLILAALPSVLLAAAAVLAFYHNDAWGWFLFCAVVTAHYARAHSDAS